MARETVGGVLCFSCAEHPAEIRRNKKGKLYLFCAESCGLVQATGKGAQARLEVAARGPAPPVPLVPVPAEKQPSRDKGPAQIVAPARSQSVGSRPALAKPVSTPVSLKETPAVIPPKKTGDLSDWFGSES